LDINLTHPIRATQLAISRFLGSEKPKSIVHISSIAGQTPFFAAPIYVATKHAINGLVRSLGRLEKESGIRITAVAPGVIKTPLWTEHPEKLKMINELKDGWVTPEEVARAMLALVEQDEITDGGIPTDDGKPVPIAGGTILEVSKRVREVLTFGDPGPGKRLGNTVTDAKAVEEESLRQLDKKGWGRTKS
jgi:3-hydroxybutyrate dehydrogenase